MWTKAFCLSYFIFFIGYAALAMDNDGFPVFTNTHLKMAYKTCQAFIDFEQSNLEQNETNPILAPACVPFLKENIEAAEKIKDYLIKGEQQLLTCPQVLKTLLETRLHYLHTRKCMVKTIRHFISQKTYADGKIPFYGPTKPEFFEKLPDGQKSLARNSTDRYQLINQILLYVWKGVEPRQLPSDVKTLVRCSPTLWGNLRGEREYLGHPDEAILVYEGENLPYPSKVGSHRLRK